MFRIASALNLERPGVVQPVLMGHSVERRSIWAFRVRRPGDEVHTKVLVFAGIHALEWISTQTAAHALEALALSPPRGVEVVVVPCSIQMDAPGSSLDLAAGLRRYRRGNARKVDLNRDFAVNRDAKAFWHHIIPAYYSSSRAPLSQPETRALDGLTERERFDVALGLTPSAGSSTPLGRALGAPEDWTEFHRLGTVMSQAQGAHAYKVRQLSRWGVLLSCPRR